MGDGKIRKIPVNWTIDKDVWDAITIKVNKASAQAGVKVSTSAIVNQLLKIQLGLVKDE